MAVYSTIHMTKTYSVASYNYGYERSQPRYNFMICFAGNQNWYTIGELMERRNKLTKAHSAILDIVRRKYGVN